MDITSYLLGKESGGGATLQEKSVTITENGTTNVTADSGYDGLSKAVVTTNVSGGADLSEYFYNTYQGGTWIKLIKKLPSPISLSGSTFTNFFNNYPGTKIPQFVFDTTNVALGSFYSNCTNATDFNIQSLENVNITSNSNMFKDCSSVQILNMGNVHFKGTETTNMFANCHNLETLSIASYDMSGILRLSSMFNNVTNLKNLIFGYDLGKGYLTTQAANYNQYSLDLSPCTLLTHDSLMSVINGLYDIASAGVQPQKLVLGATNLAKLSEVEKNIITNKGWTLS